MIAGAFLLAAAVAGVLSSRNGGAAAPTARAPLQVALVYATPVGDAPFPRRELIFRASPTGGDPVRLAAGTNPLLSPDGRWVAYRAGLLSRPSALRLISSDGGAPRAAKVSADPLVWSPDSQLLLVHGPGGVSIVDARSLRSTRLRVPEGSGSFSFSPDARTGVFERSTGSSGDIYTISITSGAIRRLTEGGRSAYPLWGPSGIAFERFGAGRCANCHGDVWLMNPSGDDARQLTHTHAGIHPAAWSGDGTRMLAAYPAIDNGRLYAVDVATGRARPLTPFVGDLYAQGLSRDGKTILAAIGCGAAIASRGLVETIPFGGGRPTVVVRGPCRASWNA